jgi:hypothetical protein
MSGLRVSNLRGVTAGSAPTFPDGVVVTGVSTATTFDGNLTGNVTGNVVGNVTGDVTGNVNVTGDATFTGDVSIGGTLTYQDVTNVDSIGVVTARGGIKVGAGQSISAVSGIITYYGDGSQLQGVESGVSNFVASGTLSNGQTVIVNTDGTVSGVSTSAVAESKGSIVQYEPGGSGVQYPSGVSIGNGKVVFAYSDFGNSRYGTAVVGTISGSTITFGTPVVFQSARVDWCAVTYDSANDRIVVCFADGGANGKAKVAQVIGTGFGAFGTLTQFHGGNTSYIQANYDSVSGKIVISYLDSTPNWGKVSIGEITSGTTNITFGSDTTFNGSNTALTVASTFDVKKNRVLVAFRNSGDSNRSYAVVGQISGTSISFGTPQKFTNNAMGECQVVYNPDANSAAGSSLIIYQDASYNDWGRCLGAQIDPSNNSITFGQILPFHDAGTSAIGATYDPNAQRYIVSYRDTGDSNKFKVDIGYEQSPGANNGYFRDYQGTGNAFEISTTTIYNSFPIYNAQDKNIALGIDDDGVVYAPPSVGTNLTATNYIGIAGEAISNGATGKVTIFGGTNSGQTGLTTAQTYYVQNDGSLGTSAGNPSVVAGTSISSTKIIVKG